MKRYTISRETLHTPSEYFATLLDVACNVSTAHPVTFRTFKRCGGLPFQEVRSKAFIRLHFAYTFKIGTGGNTFGIGTGILFSVMMICTWLYDAGFWKWLRKKFK